MVVAVASNRCALATADSHDIGPAPLGPSQAASPPSCVPPLHQPRPPSLPVDSSSRAPPALALAFAPAVSHTPRSPKHSPNSPPDSTTRNVLSSPPRYPAKPGTQSRTTHHLQPAEAFFSFTLTSSSASIAHSPEFDLNLDLLTNRVAALSLLIAEPVSAPYTKTLCQARRSSSQEEIGPPASIA
ncbi:hypothetical protein PaG_03949 [Moesziomyces aphidis]|uniref:Uncharacterized protein n=1 Tax=Moesziomyces aphidis TaxID=84754 RepID=W3VK20_MOEAP|nr:hypothetical protein PaG_03949 [Moesziomyces aphidis]